MNGETSELDRWFVEQMQPHEPALRAWLRGRFPGLGDHDDVIQEAYVRVLRAKRQGAIASPKSFLFTTARNLALDLCRRAQAVGFEPLTEMESPAVKDTAAGPRESTSHKQELELLKQAIASLPTRCRDVLTLRKLHGLSQREIAARLGISEHTVEAQIGNGVRRCAEFLARYGLP